MGFHDFKQALVLKKDVSRVTDGQRAQGRVDKNTTVQLGREVSLTRSATLSHTWAAWVCYSQSLVGVRLTGRDLSTAQYCSRKQKT
jgi:hypothetical protein